MDYGPPPMKCAWVVPDWIMSSQVLSPAAKVVLMALADAYDRTAKATVMTSAQVGAAAGMTARAATNAMKELVDDGLLHMGPGNRLMFPKTPENPGKADLEGMGSSPDREKGLPLTIPSKERLTSSPTRINASASGGERLGVYPLVPDSSGILGHLKSAPNKDADLPREGGTPDHTHCPTEESGNAQTGLWEEFRSAYPRRLGDLGLAAGRRKFILLLRDGVNPQEVIDGARNYRSLLARLGRAGTEYVKQIPAFLNQRTWEEYSEKPATIATPGVISRPMFKDQEEEL